MFDFRSIWNRNTTRRHQERNRRKTSAKLARRRLLLESLEERRVMDATPTKITVNPTTFSNPSDIVAIGNTAFFVANDGTHGAELWKTDGTSAGTTLVADINPGATGSGATDLVNANGTLYFSANDGTHGYELWKSDGTSSGTVMVSDIFTGTSTVPSSSGGSSTTEINSSHPANITVFNGKIYFTATSATGQELWTSDGTAAGTTQVVDLFPGTTSSGAGNSSDPSHLTVANGKLFFAANNGTSGSELWVTGGTAATTTLVSDIFPGTASDSTPNSSNPNNLTNVNNTLFFTANDGTNGTELWKSDGTSAGTTLVKNIFPGSSTSSGSSVPNSSLPQNLTAVGNTLFFFANDGTTGQELWKSDGTTAGTVQVADLTAGSGGNLSYFGDMVNLNGTLIFSGNNGTTGKELWKSDGTAAGTVLVQDLNLGTTTSSTSGGGTSTYPNSSYPYYMTNVNGTVYFSASNSTSGRELWRTDGTSAGTVQIPDIDSGSTSSDPQGFVALNGNIVFTATGDGNIHGTDRDLYVVPAATGSVAAQTGNFRLSIYVNDQQVTIPTNVGVQSNGTKATVFSTDATGDLSFNSANTPTLGDFFNIWQTNGGLGGNNTSAVLTANNLLGHLTDSTHTLSMFVNGQLVTSFANQQIHDGDQIVLDYGTNPVVSLNTNFGPIVVELYQNQSTVAGKSTPLTVANFLSYVDSGAFNNTFFNRLVSGFVLQGGGFTTPSTTYTSTSQFSTIPTSPAVTNEPGISNTVGTIAMAKLGGDPNSATDQFFVNLADNSSNLDNQNGGFTVFGKVLDMTTVNKIATSTTATAADSGNFASLPVSSTHQIPVIQSIAGDGEVTGTVYRDANSNGTKDSTETGISGITVYVDANNNGIMDSGEVSTTTDSSGNYLLQLAPGSYTIRSVAAAGSPSGTTSNPASISATVKLGITTSSENFGYATTAVPPTVKNDAFTVPSTATAQTLNVLANDVGASGSSTGLTLTAVTQGAHGTVTISGTQVTYTPASGFSGTDSFTYTATDTNGLTANGTASITVTNASAAPTATNDSFTVSNSATAKSLNVLANDTGVSGSSTGLTVTAVTQPTHGTVTFTSSGVSYTPTSGFVGTDTFTYTITDTNSKTGTGTVTVHDVTQTPPTAVNDTFSVLNNVTATALNVLTNDTGVSGSSTGLTVTAVTQPSAGGTVAFTSTGVTYTPASGHVGTETFTYTVTDTTGLTSTATVTVTDKDSTLAPTATADTFTELNNVTNQSLNVLANDTGLSGSSTGLTITAVTQGSAGGTVAFTSTGLTYTPKSGFVGTDTFTYTITDTNGKTATANVTVTDQDSTLTNSISGVVYIDTNNSGTQDSNEMGVPGVQVTLTDTSNTSFTPVTILSDANGAYTFTKLPSGTFKVTETPTGALTGGQSLTTSSGATTSANTISNITLGGGTNATANNFTASTVTPSYINITWFFASSGTQTHLLQTALSTAATKAGNTVLAASILAGSTTINTSVTAVADTYTVVAGKTLTTTTTNGVLANDVDPNGQKLTATLGTNVTHGTLTLNSNGTFVYTPTSGYTGTDTFTYTATDGTISSTPTTVTITVASSSAITTAADTYTATAGQALTVTAANGVLHNDVDPTTGAYTLTAALGTNVSHGTLSLSSNGSFVYTPNSGFTGTDTFTYTATDGTLTASATTVTITVKSNITTNADSYSVVTGHSLTTTTTNGVLANDTDPTTGATLTAALGTNVTHGTLSLSSNGTFTYTPTSGYTGTDSFTYTATDGTTTSAPATVTITVQSAATITATPDTYTAATGQTLTVSAANGVLHNDTDPTSGATMAAHVVATTTHGTLNLATDGSFTYAPNSGFTGTDTFTYNVTDGTLTSATVTDTITVSNGVVANTDSYTASAGKTLTVAAANSVLANDINPVSGTTLTATVVTPTSHGTLTMASNGTFTYTPNSGFTGSDTFTYQATNGTTTSAVITDTINVSPNIVANGDAFTATENHTLNVVAANGILHNDVDPTSGATVTAILVSTTTHGTLSLHADGSLIYVPNTGFTGTDTFTYQATDGTLTSTTTTATITVNAVTITANSESYTAVAGQSLSVNAATGVLANDVDPVVGGSMTANVVASTTHGTLILNANGSFSYTPNAGFTGTDSFTYRATDGTITSSTITDTITVNAPSIVTKSDAFTATSGSTLFIPVANGVLANDVDQVAGQTMTATLFSTTTHGTLTLNPNGSFSYTPASNFTGTDTFTYKATDGTLTSPTTTATITVTAPPPTITTAPDVYTMIAGQTLNTTAANGVLTNDVDSAGTALFATLVTAAAHGSLTLNANGSIDYLPDSNFVGTDTFTYQANDGTLTSAITTVTIHVDPMNTITGNADTYSTSTGQTLTVPVAQGVLANDVDSSASATMTATVGTTTQHGTLTFNSNGSFTYAPTSGFTGTDTFTYTATDGTLTSSLITATIKVNPSATITANDISYSTPEGINLVVPAATGILANAFDPTSGATLTASVVAAPTHGILELQPNGAFTYIPASGFSGTDSFTYHATDGTLTSATKTVTISVPVNIVTTPDAYTITTGQTLTIADTSGVLTNDADPTSGATMLAQLVTNVAHGTLTLNDDGSLTYVPNSGFTGTDTFTYQATDGVLTSPVTKVTITVAPIVPAVTAVADSYPTIAGKTLNVPVPSGILSNDTDSISGATLTAQLVTPTTQGALELNPDGSFSYTPTSSTFVGTDTFTYRATDGTATSALTTVTIHVDSSTAITTSPDTYNVVTSQQLATTTANGVLHNDVDPTTSATMTAVLGTTTSHGTLALSSNGTFTYTSSAGFTGTDTFTYAATDGTLTSSLTTVTINVTAPASAPVSNDDNYSGPSGQALSISAANGVLANDTSSAGTTLTATIMDSPTFGTVTLNSNGSFVYTPNSGFNGDDTFTYTASDGTNTTTPTTVTILIDTAPTTVADSYSISSGSVLNEPAATGVLANDTASGNLTLTATKVTDPAHGTLTLNDDGSFTYTPDQGYTGSDLFQYQADDGFLHSGPTIVSLSVTAVVNPPVGVADSYNVVPNGSITTETSVLANDTDPLNRSLTAQLVTGTSHGTLSLASNGTFTYTPDTNFNGTDSFTYVANNGSSSSQTTTATIVVDSLPTAVADTYTIAENGTLTATAATGVLANDTKGAGNSNTLSALLQTNPTNGTITLSSDGSFVYKPTANYTGPDSFTYLTSDGVGVSSQVTVSITVTATNATPAATNDTYSTQVGATVAKSAALGVLANDTDADGNVLTAKLLAGPSNGTLTLNSDGSFNYAPNANFHGTDTFTYQANDGLANSNTATVTITVNTLPVANADAYSATAGTTLVVPLGTGVLHNDIDADGLPMTAVLVNTTTNGLLTLSSDGSFNYVPATGFTGTDFFTYTANDAAGTSTAATATITVASVATPAAAASDVQSVNELMFSPAVEGEAAQYASNVDQVFGDNEDWSPASNVV